MPILPMFEPKSKRGATQLEVKCAYCDHVVLASRCRLMNKTKEESANLIYDVCVLSRLPLLHA